MPHTSHSRNKKRIQPQKRIEVTDENGWTHVTTGGNLKRTLRKAVTGEQQPQSQSQSESETQLRLQLHPAEAPKGLTIDELRRQYQVYREKWENSTAWDVVRGALLRRRSAVTVPAAPSSDQPAQQQLDDGVDSIICLGLGSPSGFLRGGWVDRRNVSMYQLAAFGSIVDFFKKGSSGSSETLDSNTTTTPKIYAQDPVFNTLDKSLLHSLGITVLEHPAAFDMIKKNDQKHRSTFLYCPGAERVHIEELLSESTGPALLFGGPLEEHDDSEILAAFLGVRESVRIPVFEPCEHAFWNMRLYWRGE